MYENIELLESSFLDKITSPSFYKQYEIDELCSEVTIKKNIYEKNAILSYHRRPNPNSIGGNDSLIFTITFKTTIKDSVELECSFLNFKDAEKDFLNKFYFLMREN